MAGIGSSTFYITQLSKLIYNYVVNESASARAVLSEMNLKGTDFIDALDNAKLDLEKDSFKYEILEEDYKDFTNSLETLIQEKEGPLIEEIKELIKEHKLE
jgi:DNA-dependent RNA polymerase auxiliary subunit epsilon